MLAWAIGGSLITVAFMSWMHDVPALPAPIPQHQLLHPDIAEEAYCPEIEQRIYEGVREEVSSVNALTPIEELCWQARFLRQDHPYELCLALEVDCDMEIYEWTIKERDHGP